MNGRVSVVTLPNCSSRHERTHARARIHTPNPEQVLPHLALGQQSEGTPLWSTMFTAPTADSYIWLNGGIVSDASGNIYGANYMEGTGNVTNGDWTVQVPSGGGGAFIYKLNTTLGVTWLVAPGGTASYIDANNVALDPSGSTLVVIGSFASGTMVLDSVTLTAPTSRANAFVLALDAATGVAKWGQAWTGTGRNEPYGVGIDSAGNIIFNGRTGAGTIVVNSVTYDAGSIGKNSWSMKV